MKILILEDSLYRNKTFTNKLSKKHDVYIYDNVQDATDAIELIGPFDLYFLDHDLDGEMFVGSEKANTGFQLAKYMAEKKTTGSIIIHSLNPVGAANIKAELPQALVIPFSSLSDVLDQVSE